MGRIKKICALLAVLAVAPAVPTQAADVRFLPTVEAGAFYDDNFETTAEQGAEVEASGVDVGLDLLMRVSTPRTTFSFAPGVQGVYFASSDTKNYVDPSVRLEWGHQRTRSEMGFLAHYERQTIFQSVRLSTDIDADLGEAEEVSLGEVDVVNKRDRLRVMPKIGLELTQRMSMDVSASYSDVKYDRYFVGEQQDYSNVAGSVGLGYAATQRSTLSLIGTAAKYEPDTLPGATTNAVGATSYGLAGRWRGRWSETQQAYIELGVVRSEFEDGASTAVPTPQSETSYGGGLGTSWRFQVTRLFIDASRRVQPSGIGGIQVQDDVRFQLERDFSARLSGVAGARLTDTSRVQTQAASSDQRRYITSGVGLKWRATRAVSVGGEYQNRWRKSDTSGGSATANEIRIYFAYERPEQR